MSQLLNLSLAFAPGSTDIRQHLPTQTAFLCAGVVDRRPEVSVAYARLIVELERCRDGVSMVPTTGRVLLYADALSKDLHEGSRVRFPSRLRPPGMFRNPGTESFGLRQRSQGIVAVGRLSEPQWLRVMEPYDDGLRAVGVRWRESMERLFTERPVHADVRAVLRAMILGQGEALDSTHWERFRRVGVIHVLVVSGLHVGVVALVLYVVIGWLLRRSAWLLLRVPVWRIAAACAVIGCWGYVWLTGARLPAMRAAILVTCLLAAVIVDRRRDIASALALAGIIILVQQPIALWLPSFQLTFAAVVAILVWGPWLSRMIVWTGWRRNIWNGIAVTCAATIGVLPIVAYHFHESSLMGIVANIVIVPWVSLVMVPLGLVFLVVAPWWPWVGVPLGASASVLLQTVTWADQWSGAWQLHFTPLLAEIVVWYAAFALCVILSGRTLRVILREQRDRRISLITLLTIAIVGICVAGFQRIGPHMGTQPLRLTFLDVAQGSATVVQFPNGSVYVVDGGGVARSAFDMGRWVVAPFLHRQQIRSVDALVMTHYHPDHYAGLAYLAETFGAKVLYTNGSTAAAKDVTWPVIHQRFEAAGIERKALTHAMATWSEGDVSIRVLHPGSTAEQDSLSENDRSIVLELTHQDVRILLTGDIEEPAEELLVVDGHVQKVDLAQAPHHGSDTSSTAAWVEAVQPQHVVISCGRHNRYNFPRDEVLERYQRSGAQIYRTDLQGAITATSDGKSIQVAPHVLF